MTEATNEQWTMLMFWVSQMPKISAKELVGHFVRRFGGTEATAWIVVTRFRNQEHSKQYGG